MYITELVKHTLKIESPPTSFISTLKEITLGNPLFMVKKNAIICTTLYFNIVSGPAFVYVDGIWS